MMLFIPVFPQKLPLTRAQWCPHGPTLQRSSFCFHLVLDPSKNVTELIISSPLETFFPFQFQDNTFYWLSSYLNDPSFMAINYFLLIPNLMYILNNLFIVYLSMLQYILQDKLHEDRDFCLFC